MALTAHKTDTMFMHYVHTKDDPVRTAAHPVASRRQGLIGSTVGTVAIKVSFGADNHPPETTAELTREADKPLGLDDGNYSPRTKLGNYRPFRHRSGPHRDVHPDTKRNVNQAKAAADAE